MKMKITELRLAGAKEITLPVSTDMRGSFTKIYHEGLYQEAGIAFQMREQYISVSGKDVIRGMHFQLPPYDCAKLVTVLEGAALDVILDLRTGSPTYLQAAQVELRADQPKAVLIPAGFAHGFLALKDHTSMLYDVSAVYSPQCDTGIRWDSFGFVWPVQQPLISQRDSHLMLLDEFQTPFSY